MRKLLSAILLVIGSLAWAQDQKPSPKLLSYEKDLRAEMIDLTTWGQHEKLYELTDSERMEPSVIIKEVVGDYIEFPKISETETQVYRYHMVYKRVHLNEDKGVESYNKIYIPIKSEIDLVDLRAHTISKTGKMSKEFNETDMKTIEEEGSRYMILALDGVEKGGEVEFYFIIRKNIPNYGDLAIQNETFKREFTYTMRIHHNIEYMFKGYNGCPPIKEEEIGDYNIYTLNVSKIPVHTKENMQNYDAELMRVEYLLAYLKNKGRVRQNTFADFTKTVYGNITAEKEKSKGEIKKLTKKLKLQDVEGTEDKIRTIENWIKTNVVYVQIGGLSSVKEIIKNHYAGELGILRLYAYMFDENNIKYELWSTCKRSEKEFDESFESFNFLNDYYFYFPSVNKFLDFKNIAWRLGIPPSEILGQKSVKIKVIDLGDDLITAKYTIGTCDIPSCDQTNEIMSTELTYDPASSKIKAKIHMEEDGYQNYIKGMYSLVTDAAKKKQIVEDHIKRFSSDAKISKMEMKNEDINDLEQINRPFILDAEYTASKIVENAGDNVIIKIGQVIGEQSELYKDKPRQSKFFNPYPHKYTRTIVLNIPEGYSLKGLEGINIDKRHKLTNGTKTDSIGFVSAYKVENGKLTITCTEYYECLEWPVDKKDDYTEVINAAADFNKISVILEPNK
jgi:hypothetical protein